MGKVFGGSSSKQKSTSDNRAFDSINNTFSPVTANTKIGADGIAALLGGDSTGFDKYKQATGFDFQGAEGAKGITGNAAAQGLLRSGGTGRELVRFGNELQNQYSNNYMDRLLGLSNIGLGAGNLISGAGQRSVSSSKSKSKPGFGGFLGKIASGIATGGVG